MRKVFSILTVALVVLLFAGCKSETGAYYDYETVCLNTESDGSITVRVWGEGRNISDAMHQAKKNAVDEVLFKGITRGLSGYMSRPVVPEVNAREKYQDYFNQFFKDGGEYEKYVTWKDRRWGTSQRKKVGTQVKWGITMRVLVPELKAKMKEDGILK